MEARDAVICPQCVKSEHEPAAAFCGVSGFFFPDFYVLVPRNRLFAFQLLLVGCADLDKLKLGGDLGLYASLQLRGIAIRVGMLCGIWAIGKCFPWGPPLPRSPRGDRRVNFA